MFQYNGQRKLQDETRNSHVLGFGVSYIRDLTVAFIAITPHIMVQGSYTTYSLCPAIKLVVVSVLD